jgi:TMEM175 potassium channel family protein
MEGSHAARSEAVSFGRIVSFSDGVFAIAITLLVLNFEVPHVHDETERQLAHFLDRLAGDFGAYFLSFAVLGRLWIVHHRLFSLLATFDGRLITLNLLYLAMIVLVPFPAELLGDYGTEPLPAALYAAVLAAASGLNWLMARHAARAGLLHPDRRDAVAPWTTAGALYIPGVFAASIPVAFLSPVAAELMWVLLVLSRANGAWRGGRPA